MTDGQRREGVEQRSKENEKKHTRAWFLGFYVDVEGAKGPGRSALLFPFSRSGAGAAPDIKAPNSRRMAPRGLCAAVLRNRSTSKPSNAPCSCMALARPYTYIVNQQAKRLEIRDGGRVFIFQVQCDAYTCTIKKMGSAAYIVNKQAKRLEIRDD